MKFPQLPLGARFTFQGKTYTKTSPMMANADDGSGARVIPRWAECQTPDARGAIEPPARPARPLDYARVIAALDAYHAECTRLIDTQHVVALQEARQRFIAALDNPDSKPA
jgi:hypothetical protein